MTEENYTKTKKISVIVPVYNVANYLKRCVDSLLVQTMNKNDFEIILVDDGSTDGSGNLCDEYQANFEQIRTLHKQNGGLSDARNYALQYARGDYLLFIDSDDFVESEMLERMYAQSDDGSKKIVECNFFWDFEDKTRLDVRQGYDSLADYLVNGRVVAWNKLYLREWIERTKVTFPVGKLYEDQNFFFKVVAWLNDISEVAIDTKCEVHYVQRSNSISYSETGRIAEIIWIYDDILNYYKEKQLFKEYNDELEYRFYRNLFGNVLLRKVIKLKDKKIRTDLLDLIWQKTQEWFPNRKDNKYLKKLSAKNLYLRTMNHAFYRLFYLI
ncbi:glycosyltransferase [Liquorilactobacillus mali]|uniref:glycosyltransferase family 2 protein n=1 Tax=Liquorilactobacillus mali TaxID=1618 RepID=UPI00264C3F1A|nr:glycosyltransferase [Liquorilactobacillus mali]MDN7145535.1 glycosyltransferase [Liquorilactobacillus mali]